MGTHAKPKAGGAGANAVEARDAAELRRKDQVRWQLQAHEALGRLLHEAFEHALPPLRWEVMSAGSGLAAWCDTYPEHERPQAFAAWRKYLGSAGSPDRTSDHTARLTGGRRLLAHWESYHPAGSRRGISLSLIADVPAAAIGGEGE